MKSARGKIGLMSGICIVITTLVLILMIYSPKTSPGGEIPPTVRQIDHIMVQVPDPGPVYRLFTDDLGLPVAWPMTDYGSFSTGGVSFGNVNMEILNSSPQMKEQGVVPIRNGIVGVAFQPIPGLEQTVRILDEGQVSHSEIMPFTAEINGTNTTLWNSLVLNDVMPGTLVFYCEYTFNQTGFRQRMESALAAANGGAAGITGLKEIAVGYADPAVMRHWQNILPEAPGGQPEYRDGGNGVRVHLFRSNITAVSSITVQVRSLDQVKAVLGEKGILETGSDDQVFMRPDTISGIRIFFTE
jgi:hypothetical protein